VVRDILLFLSALAAHWLFTFGGVALVAFGVIEKYRHKETHKRIYWGVAVGLLMVASYQAWNDEHRNTEDVIKQRQQAEIDKNVARSQADERQKQIEYLAAHPNIKPEDLTKALYTALHPPAKSPCDVVAAYKLRPLTGDDLADSSSKDHIPAPYASELSIKNTRGVVPITSYGVYFKDNILNAVAISPKPQIGSWGMGGNELSFEIRVPINKGVPLVFHVYGNRPVKVDCINVWVTPPPKEWKQ
jgi:hypothetical protein